MHKVAINAMFSPQPSAGLVCLGLGLTGLLTGCGEQGQPGVSGQAPAGVEIVHVADPAQNAAPAGDDAGQSSINFSRDIRPILSDRCFACHGPDAASSEKLGGFRLDSFEAATAVADSGTAPIVPGDPANSEVVRRINASDRPNIQMPPPDSHLKLTPAEIDLLTRWIAEGAEYTRHWAYESPVKAELPAIEHGDWANNAIDYFVAAKMEQAGLSPSDAASRATLIRRVSLDLTGLPPTPQEIDAFVNDTSDDAYESLVDRLLGSPHFGERVAMVWLDAARYADTNGFHHDNIRTSWPWRQWVIQAFNDNMPYDQFIIEQLAGDLLPNATVEQRLASGFCRMHNINDEGGALDEEYRVEAVADRIETISTVFLAQTMTCSRCHDHKYDPISQDDYYSLYAYFNSVEERGVFPNNAEQARAYPARMMYLPKESRLRHAELTDQRAPLAAERDAAKPSAQAWQQAIISDQAVRWVGPQLLEAKAGRGGATLTAQPDGSILASDKNPNKDTFTLRLRTDATGLRVIRFDALRDPSMPEGRLGRAPNGNAVLTQIEVSARSVADPKQSRKLDFVFAHADHEQQNGDYDIQNALRPDALGWAVDGHQKDGNRRVTLLTGQPFGYDGGTELVVTLRFQSRYAKHTLGRVRVDAGTPVAEQLPTYPEAYFELVRQVAGLDAELADIESNEAVPVLIMKELNAPVQMHILDRGAYDGADLDRPVTRHPPASMGNPDLPEGAPNNRLGFAQWLTQPDHPLTARVHVNRFWQMIFGTGIVATSEDFGSQAEWPSHPELLDYLAVDFAESGWDQKALVKQIVMSATYRQRAVARTEAMEIDPANRLLSYFPRRRLPGEMIRDQALFVAGLMNDAIGGPSVRPYQPGGLWTEVSIGGSSNTNNFKRDDGQALYRRSMYTFWKRTSPPPQMATFNAPTREFCVVRRDVTNTPLQTLVLWNDEQFLEAARALAQRTLGETDDPDAGLSLIYQRCTGKTPNDRALAVLRDTLVHFQQRYAESPEDAAALLTQGEHPLPEQYDPAELAAWMMVSSAVLSLDETIVRD